LRKGLQIFSILVFALLAACSNPPSQSKISTSEEVGKVISVEGGTYRDITVTELEHMLENKDFLLVNTHIPFEGDLPNTDLSIPFDEITQHLDKLPADKNAKIVLYCRSSRMSKIAAKELVKLGYTNLWQLDGGFNAWKDAGLPMTDQ